jgi:hypothetical protein
VRLGGIVTSAAIIISGFYGIVFSQNCNTIDAVTSASFRITGGEACQDYANLSWAFRRSNGEMNIEWGTSESYGSQKSVYESNPINLTGLAPNTTYYYHVWGEYSKSGTPRTYEYTKSSFTTSGGAPLNQPPVITNNDETISCTTEATFTYTLIAQDPEGDNIIFSAENLPEWITLENTTLTFEPTAQSTDTEIKIIASDGNDGMDTLDLTVTVQHVVGVVAGQSVARPLTLTFGTTRVNVPAMAGQPLHVALYSLNGTKMMQKSIKVAENANYGGLLPAGIVPGIYIVQVNSIAGKGTCSIGVRE